MKASEIERSFKAGECILETGATTSPLFVVRSGLVALEGEDGREETTLGRGEIFGEIPALLGAASPYGARAAGEASVLALEPWLLDRLTRECAEFNVRLVSHLASRLRDALEALPEATDAAPIELERFVRALLERATGSEGACPVRGHLAELASGAGLPIRHAYYCLHDLLDRGLVRLVDDQLTLLDGDALRHLAG